MSQKKVDAYKEKKANRGKIMKREKAILRLEKAVGYMIVVVAVVWVCFSVYDKVNDGAVEVKTETVMDTSALDNYISELAAEDTDTDEEPEGEISENEVSELDE